MSAHDRRCASAQAWWEQLFTDHHARVLATCRAILHRHDDAEDATQEVFARVPVDPEVIVDARRWLLEVARNVCIDMLRRRRHRTTLPLDVHLDRLRVRDTTEVVVERLFLHWLLCQLPVREGAVLSRQVLLDEPLTDVAHHFGVSYAVAGKLAARARRRGAGIAAMDLACAVA